MALKVGDEIRFQPLYPAVKMRGSSSGLQATEYSLPVDIRGYREFAAFINLKEPTTVTMRNTVTAKLLVGTTTYASPTAFTSVANSSFTVCASGATQTDVNFARVSITGTATKVGTAFAGVILEGATYTFSDTADSSVVVHTTNCSLAMAKLATCIKNNTNLDATYYAMGVTTGPAYCEIWRKDGKPFDITSTAITVAASADGIGLTCARSAMFEFKAEDIQALSSSVNYTHVIVRLNATGTVYVADGVLAMGGGRYTPDTLISRGQLATVSSAYTT